MADSSATDKMVLNTGRLIGWIEELLMLFDGTEGNLHRCAPKRGGIGVKRSIAFRWKTSQGGVAFQV
jgi:hypothetical protein